MRFLRIALTVVILGFVVSAFYISALVFQRQSALEGVGLGNVTWMVAQAPSEFARLEQRVSAFGMGDGETSAEEVKLRFDIVVNRLKTLRANSVEEFVLSDSRIDGILDDLEKALDATRPLIADIAAPGMPAQILSILDPIYPQARSSFHRRQCLEHRPHRGGSAGPVHPAMGLHLGRHRHDRLRLRADRAAAAA